MTSRAIVFRAVWAGAFLACAGGAQAQQVPPQIDAGAIGRESRRLEQSFERQIERDNLGAAVTSPRRDLQEVTTGGPTFSLKSVQFGTSAFLSPEELQAIAAPYLNGPITLGDVQRLVNSVDALYSERGHTTASAILPPQKVKDGLLRVDLVEGRVGKVTVEGGDTSLDYVQRRVTLEPGSVVDVPRLTGEIATFNRTSETQIRTALQPGTQFGLTDVTLSAIEPARNQFQIFGDNLGVETVGRYQGGALFQHYGLLGRDDRIKVYVVQSPGNASQNASYTFAMNDAGGRLGLSYSRSDIQIIEGPFRKLNVKGGSQVGALNFSQPLYGDGDWLISLTGSAAFSTSVTKQDTVHVTDNFTKKGTIGLSFNYYGDGFVVSVAPNYSYAKSYLAVTEKDLAFHLFTGSASLAVQLPAQFYLQGTASAQVSSVPLLPGEQLFQLGGSSILRGFPSNAVAGSSGYLGSLELHRNMSDLLKGLDLFTFVDHGTVYSTFPKRTTLNSAGVGMSFTYENVTAELTAAFPLDKVVTKQSAYELYGRVIIKVF